MDNTDCLVEGTEWPQDKRREENISLYTLKYTHTQTPFYFGVIFDYRKVVEIVQRVLIYFLTQFLLMLTFYMVRVFLSKLRNQRYIAISYAPNFIFHQVF